MSAALIQFVWQGLAVALLLFGTQFVLRKRSAQSRYLAACAALAIMAVLPVVTALLHYRSAGTGTSQPGADWTLPVWAAGVAIFSLRPVWSLTRIYALRRRGTAPEAWISELGVSIAKRTGLTRAFRILISTISETPAVIGWLRPVILLPAATIAGLTVEQLETVLAHEIAHIRRHDYLVNLLQVLVETLLFYHPAVWWVSFCIRRERELCCDDEVVRFAGDALCYARALTTLERLRSATPALAMGGAGGELSYRIRRLVGDAPAQRERWPAIFAAALALLCATACARWARTPEVTDAVTVEVTADERGVVTGARVLSGPADLRARALRSALTMPLEGKRSATFTFPKDEIRRVQVLRHELEDFRKQYKGNRRPGSNPALEARYERNLRELAAAEWEAEQP
jgi:beta-lactamase regulating signal transducer with metallopeptidase domain